MKTKNKVLSLFLWYIPVLIVQLASSWVTYAKMSPWYGLIKKASWNPPSWLFAPVWTIIYLMMTVSVWLVYHTAAYERIKRRGYILFFVQLALNGLWSFLFFGLHEPLLALIDLSLLIIAEIATIVTFYKIHKGAASLLFPYLIWTLYAETLNGAVVILNR